jgi:hypothetical protein
MKLYNVKLPTIESFNQVRAVAKRADAFAIVSVDNNDAYSFGFQSKIAAEAVASAFNGTVETIDYDVTKIFK